MSRRKSIWSKYIWVIVGILFIGIGLYSLWTEHAKTQQRIEQPTLFHQQEQSDSLSNTSTDSSLHSIVSWNLFNFGQSKNDSILAFIAQTVGEFDIVAIQEVVGKSGGEEAVIRLMEQLQSQCSACNWKSEISPPTTGSPNKSERYAYLWKGSNISPVGKGYLDENFKEELEREPFIMTFMGHQKKPFTLVSFHAVPKSSQPETEIKYFRYFPELYPEKTLFFLGDFNLPQSHNVYNPLKKMGYVPSLIGQKTSLRQRCIEGDCLASEYDNIFYPRDKIQVTESGIIHFYSSFNEDMKKARRISDHVPVFLKFEFTN